MNQLTNYKYKIDFLISNDTSLIQQPETILKPKAKRKIHEKCNECNKRRRPLDESHQICRICYNMKKTFKPSGNKIVDDFIRYTQINLVRKEGKLKFVPYNEFKNLEFIAEGGFSKIYKATWVNRSNKTVVLKKLNNSKNITAKELNELKIFYNYLTKWKTQYDNAYDKLKANKISPETYATRGNYISDYFGSDIGPITTNNPGAIYKSRPLSGMINSAMSLWSLRSQSVNLEKVKRKFEYNNDDGQNINIKRKKLFENENNDYFTKEIELDIDIKSLNNNGK
ncbi:unnamed protein product [Rhizophagus irregularis]|nr:unnamed protein product [Rhizophagus irregularis]